MARETRSSKYQWLILETPISHDVMSFFSNSQSLNYQLNPFQYDETLLDLQQQLADEFWKLAKQHCTEKQLTILLLTMEGYTQSEIAKKLNVNQSSVTKSLNGNKDYSYTRGTKVYGGSITKLKKVCKESPIIQNILVKIEEAKTEKL